MGSEKIKQLVNSLPDAPGIYKFLDHNLILIYVGKAKNLKKRVSNYFNKSAIVNRKTQKLVNEIDDIQYQVTNSEFDAFLLENNLIKENQPKFNIHLKDDKSFPFICILNERFPRIISIRKYHKNWGEYFGPYSSVVAMNNVLDLIRRLYTIRTCRYDLSKENIRAAKFKLCLEYHIGNCKGPCEGLQSEEEYTRDIEQARAILKGSVNTVKAHFEKKMKVHANLLEYEKAQEFKEKLNLLNKFQTKSVIVNKNITNSRVGTIISDQKKAYVNTFDISGGAIIAGKSLEVKKKMDELDTDILSHIIFKSDVIDHFTPKEVITNVRLKSVPFQVKNTVPIRGDKKSLVELSIKNAYQFKKQKIRQRHQQRSISDVLIQLRDDLRLPDIPYLIECFDNSNLMGTNAVAAMVCFKNAKPYKKEYRHFHIKTVKGIDDFQSMKEVVNRRYSRQIREKKELPNLIVIDGGKGQLSAACAALEELKIYGKIPVIGIAKKLEEIYFPKDEIPVHINKASASLKLIQQIRNEAHRFAITFHRNRRSKNSIRLSLNGVKGIGPATIETLLKKYKSVSNINKADFDEIAVLVGTKRAKILSDYFIEQKKGEQSNSPD